MNRKTKEEIPSQLLHNFGESPFKKKSEIYDELITDFGKIIINDKYLEESEIQVFLFL